MKKKILIISTSLYGGGAEKALVEYLLNFDYSKYDIDLCLEYNFGKSYDKIPDQVNIFYLYDNTEDLRCKIDYHLYKHFRFNLFEKRRIRSKIKDYYNAIISFVEGKPLKYHRYVMDRTKINISWVHADMSTNHYTIGATLSEKHEKTAYNKMEYVVFVSENAKDSFERLYGKGLSNNTVIYNPVNIDKIVELSKSSSIIKKRKTLISLGRLSKEKGYDRLLKAVKRLVDEGFIFDLWIVGDGPLRKELETIKSNLYLENVSFLGFKNPPYPYLGAADAFVSSSITEAAPIVVSEALCLGIPVVATDTAGSREMLDGGKYGILTANNEAALYEGMKKILGATSDEYLKYKNMALERSSFFSVNKSLEQLYNLI